MAPLSWLVERSAVSSVEMFCKDVSATRRSRETSVLLTVKRPAATAMGTVHCHSEQHHRPVTSSYRYPISSLHQR